MEQAVMKEEKEKVLLTWVAKSQPFKPEEIKIRPVLMVLVVLIALVLVFAQEWMLLVLMAAGGFYYYAIRRTPPMDVEFTITSKGIKAFGRMYMWWELSGWWWEERWDTKMLALDLTAAGMMGRIYIPIGKVKPEEIEKDMDKYLVMRKPGETWTDKMSGWVKEKFPLENKI